MSLAEADNNDLLTVAQWFVYSRPFSSRKLQKRVCVLLLIILLLTQIIHP